MLLIDEIIDQNEKSIVCSKTFHANEFFFQGHYPDHPIVPGVILCEVGFQAGAVLLAAVIQASRQGDTLGKSTGCHTTEPCKIQADRQAG